MAPPPTVDAASLLLAGASAAAAVETAAARRRAEVCEASRDAAASGLEEHLAIGLEAVNLAEVMLLGVACCARPAGYIRPPQLRRGDGFDDNEVILEGHTLQLPEPNADATPTELPLILHDQKGQAYERMLNEYTRLNGFRWRYHQSHGQGTISAVQAFGRRGECLLRPTFCDVQRPRLEPFIEVFDGRRLPVSQLHSCLSHLLQQALALRLYRSSLEGLVKLIEETPSITLVVPVAVFTFQDAPSAADFSRKVSRRHPHFVDAVEVGAKLNMCILPAANTPSGDLEKVDADSFLRLTGATVFRIAGTSGRLCIRNIGGHRVDPFRVNGSPLEYICRYLSNGWTHSLSARPNTWTRLWVHVASAADHEALLGPGPGAGRWATAEAAEIKRGCEYCRAPLVIGVEVVESEGKAARNPVCLACSSFVSGSPATVQKEVLAQHLSHCPISEVVGSADEGLDVLLGEQDRPEKDDATAPRRKFRLAVKDSYGWIGNEELQGLTIFAASALLELVPPIEGWPLDTAQVRQSIANELALAARLPNEAISVSEMVLGPQEHLLVGFHILHPAVIDVDSDIQEPDAVLIAYKRVVQWLKDFLQEALIESEPCGYRKPRRLNFRHWLKVKDPNKIITQCSLIVCENTSVEKTLPGPEQRSSSKACVEALDKMRDWIFEANFDAIEAHLDPGNSSGFDPQKDQKQSLQSAWPHFKPTFRQLALRLRELVVAQQASRCAQFLHRWGWTQDGSNVLGTLAIVIRDPNHFRGRSALDLALLTSERSAARALLAWMPDVTLDELAMDSHSVSHTSLGTESMSLSQIVCRSLYDSFLQGKSAKERLDLLVRKTCVELMNVPNPVSGLIPIYTATISAQESTVDILSALVRKGADLLQPCSKPPELAVAAATQLGARFLVQHLLSLRADVNSKSASGAPLLQVAVSKGATSLIDLFMSHPDIKIDDLDTRGRTALMVALRGGRREIAQKLIEAACNVNIAENSGAQPILQAAMVRDENLCKLLLEQQANPNAVDPATGSRVLHFAVRLQNMPLLTHLLAARADIHATHPSTGRSVLHAAAALKYTAAVKLLLEHRAAVDASCNVGDTPLRLAVQQGDHASVEALCEAKADPNQVNRSGCGAIHAAVAQGDLALCQLLVEHGADINLADSRRWRPIHYGAAASGPSDEVVNWLVNKGADPHARSYHGVEPHHLSTSCTSQLFAWGSSSCSSSATADLSSILPPAAYPPHRLKIEAWPPNLPEEQQGSSSTDAADFNAASAAESSHTTDPLAGGGSSNSSNSNKNNSISNNNYDKRASNNNNNTTTSNISSSNNNNNNNSNICNSNAINSISNNSISNNSSTIAAQKSMSTKVVDSGVGIGGGVLVGVSIRSEGGICGGGSMSIGSGTGSMPGSHGNSMDEQKPFPYPPSRPVPAAPGQQQSQAGSLQPPLPLPHESGSLTSRSSRDRPPRASREPHKDDSVLPPIQSKFAPGIANKLGHARGIRSIGEPTHGGGVLFGSLGMARRSPRAR